RGQQTGTVPAGTDASCSRSRCAEISRRSEVLKVGKRSQNASGSTGSPRSVRTQYSSYARSSTNDLSTRSSGWDDRKSRASAEAGSSAQRALTSASRSRPPDGTGAAEVPSGGRDLLAEVPSGGRDLPGSATAQVAESAARGSWPSTCWLLMTTPVVRVGGPAAGLSFRAHPTCGRSARGYAPGAATSGCGGNTAA